MSSLSEKSRNLRKKRFLKSYEQTFNKNRASQAAGVNRSTIFRWQKNDRDFAEQVHHIEESLLDEAESGLMDLIRKRELAAIKFALRTKGRERGYSEGIEIQQTTKQINLDRRRIEILLSDVKTREAMEIIAMKSITTNERDINHEEKVIEYRYNAGCGE
jgi:transposase